MKIIEKNIRTIIDNNNGVVRKFVPELAKTVQDTAIDFVNSLRDYERESRTLLGFDERTTEELFKKFLETYTPLPTNGINERYENKKYTRRKS